MRYTHAHAHVLLCFIRVHAVFILCIVFCALRTILKKYQDKHSRNSASPSVAKQPSASNVSPEKAASEDVPAITVSGEENGGEGEVSIGTHTHTHTHTHACMQTNA